VFAKTDNKKVTSNVSKVSNRYKGFVINLDRRPERYKQFKDQFKYVKSIDIERFSAVDGKTLTLTPELSNRISKNSDSNSPRYKRIVSCCLPHINLYKKIVSEYSSEPFVFVFEDDCAFINKTSQQRFDSISHNLKLPEDFYIIYLNKMNEASPTDSTEVINYKLKPLWDDYTFNPTFESYIINMRYLPELIHSLENNIWKIDHSIVDVVKNKEKELNKILAYVFDPPITCQYDRSDTDIQI